MKKRILACLMAATVGALAMVSCNNSGNSTSSSGSSSGSTSSSDSGSSDAGNSASGEKVTLTLPTYYIGENVGAVYFEPAVERFNAQYDGQYEIKLEEVVEASYADRMATLAQSGKLPVLISGASTTWVNTIMIPQKLYYDTSSWLKESGILDLCVPASVEYSTQEDGSIIGIPTVSVSTVGLYYNTDVYNPEKPITEMSVDEFVESLGGKNMAWQTVDNAWTTALFYTSLIANEEGGADWLVSFDGEKCYDFNNDYMIHAAEKLLEIWNKAGGSTYVGKAYADSANDFMSGNSAIICNGTWMNSEFGESGSSNWSNGFDGAKVTADYYPGNFAICSTKGYGRWIVTNNYSSDAELEAALTFMEFIYSQPELEEFALTEGCQIPALDYSEDYLTRLAADPLIAAQSERLKADTTLVPNVLSIMPDSVANSVFANELTQMVNGATTPEQFCANLTTKSEEAKGE